MSGAGRPPSAFAERLAKVRERIDQAAAAAGRGPDEIRLVAVTKTHPPSAARCAVEHGVLDLGENRVQEWEAKRDEVPGARWHLVGRLQRNKVAAVVGHDLLVHSVDRRSLVDALDRRAGTAGVLQRVLVQVNIGSDPAKGGCDLREAGDLVAYARARPNLTVEGLMTIPPMPPDGSDPVAVQQPRFAALRAQRDDLASRFPEVRELSMGMSADLEAAVAEGATMVRIGTALFGPRAAGPWRKDEV